MFDGHQLIAIFCEIDDFCKEFENNFSDTLITGPIKGKRGPNCRMTLSEIMTIQIAFQMIGYRNFKTFYTGHVMKYWIKYFPNLLSYSRFVELMPYSLCPLTIFTQVKSGKKTGIYYIDSSCLPVCHLKRSRRNKTFDEIAEYGKTSVGWFFGLKIHLVVNDRCELIAFKITKGSQHDNIAAQKILKGLNGLAFGDKGYLGKKIFDALYKTGLKLITRKRKNMKNIAPLTEYEQQLLNQRGIIETIFNCLKHKYHVWHTRHRSVFNAISHLVAALAAYVIEPLKMTVIKQLMLKPAELAHMP